MITIIDNKTHFSAQLADAVAAALLRQLAVIGHVYFGNEAAVYSRTALELRGTWLKMERDDNNGKTLADALHDNERPLPPSQLLNPDTMAIGPYLKALEIYIAFLKNR